jgi:hypothetical protein
MENVLHFYFSKKSLLKLQLLRKTYSVKTYMELKNGKYIKKQMSIKKL